MKQHLLAVVTVFLLLVTCARLILLIRDQLRRLEGAGTLVLSIPKTGSLSGIGAGGILSPAGPGLRYRLLFVIHLSNLSKDVEYWNSARKALGPQASDLDWWGICDSGSSCDGFQHTAQFSIVGFMDPYQMRIIANADVGARALMYDGSSLRGMIEHTSEPARAAEAIARLRD